MPNQFPTEYARRRHDNPMGLMPVDAPPQSVESKARPRLIDVADALCPAAPHGAAESGVPQDLLLDLVLKTVHLAPHFTTDWVVGRLQLPRTLVTDLLEELMLDRLVEIIGQDGPLTYRWAISDKGRQRAARLLQINGYVGPAPVSIDAYAALIEWQCDHLPQTHPADIEKVASALVLPDDATEIAGLAAMSRRSLFLYGPPGNGKTTIGHLLHHAMRGELWIPHAIAAADQIVRVFDPQLHRERPVTCNEDDQRRIDHRWVRVDRPFVVAAGELQLEDLDLAFSAPLGYYEAPLHMKANGGVFLLDDFGYQRTNPFQLLNRWVFPLEHGIDFLTLKTGQKLFVPFRQMLIISTNLDPESVMEPAILRRIGYRLRLGNPNADQYTEIFERAAEQLGVEMAYPLVERLIARHRAEGRPMRGCVPRDLLQRVRDVCRYHGRPFTVNEDLLNTAWHGYFGAAEEEDEH